MTLLATFYLSSHLVPTTSSIWITWTREMKDRKHMQNLDSWQNNNYMLELNVCLYVHISLQWPPLTAWLPSDPLDGCRAHTVEEWPWRGESHVTYGPWLQLPIHGHRWQSIMWILHATYACWGEALWVGWHLKWHPGVHQRTFLLKWHPSVHF